MVPSPRCYGLSSKNISNYLKNILFYQARFLQKTTKLQKRQNSKGDALLFISNKRDFRHSTQPFGVRFAHVISIGRGNPSQTLPR